MNSSTPGASSLSLPDARQGAKVPYRRVSWHNQQRQSVTCIAVFENGELRRVAREYSQRFCVVGTKPDVNGREKVLDHEGEVGHAH